LRFVLDNGSVVQLLDKLDPKSFDRPAVQMIKDIGATTQRTAQRAAKPHEADKGTFGKVIVLDILDKGYTARVYVPESIAGLAFTIEEGRRPGKRPPYGPIKRWALSHGYIPSGRGNSKFVQVIREEIKTHGTRGVFFMRQAIETAEKALREGIPRTEKEIHAAWERP